MEEKEVGGEVGLESVIENYMKLLIQYKIRGPPWLYDSS